MAGVGAERAEERLRVLTTAMRLFAEATTDIDRLLALVARHVAEVLGDSCVLLELTPDGTQLVARAAHAVDPSAMALVDALIAAEPFLLETHPAARAVIETRSALLLPVVDAKTFAQRTTSAYLAFQRDLGIHSLLAVPLHAHGSPLGLLTLTRFRSTSPSFDEGDRELALNLADHAALALSNGRLYVAEREARIAAEHAMRSHRAAEARFARFADVGLFGVVVFRLDGTILDVNPYIERLLGHSREDLVSGAVPWSTLTPEEYRDADRRAHLRLAEHGHVSLVEKEYLRADGTRVPVLYGGGRAGGSSDYVAFVLDLTERKLAERELGRLQAERAADARFRVVVEAAPDAIVITDASERITLVNGQAEHLFGYARAEMLGQPLARLLPTDGSCSPVELCGRRKDSTEFPLELTVSTLVTDEGTRSVMSIRDVSERKEAERELVAAKEAAEAANKELEAFSYSVAHDLRAPIRGMHGFAQIVLDDHGAELGPEGERLLQRIIGSATKMGALVDGLLQLSRLTRTQLTVETVDLSEIVRSIVALAPRADLELVVADGIVTSADPALVRSLLDNLVGNALKFSGKVAAPRVELGRLEGAGEEIFFVRDNGAGFDMRFATQLFAPFQRLHAASEYPGTGIGLATAQRIVHRHGGRIWAEGEEGRGATFFFTLASPLPVMSTPPSRGIKVDQA